MDKLLDEISEAEKTLESALESASGAWVTLGIRINAAYQVMPRLKQIVEREAVKTERKKGKWIVDEKRFGCTERHCSLCGAILEGDDWKWRNNNYCYHCGADMRGDENG